jgi:hypothetical protein
LNAGDKFNEVRKNASMRYKLPTNSYVQIL